MQIHSSIALFAAAAVVTHSLDAVQATPVAITNQCGESIELWDNAVVQVMAPGQVVTRYLSAGFHGMFRAGVNPQATLAELTIDGGKLWYDISIIPTGPKSGPEYCGSLQACKDRTGGVGYNIPMQIAPKGCKTRTCTYDGCPDAYQYPKDDGKTTSCTMDTTVDLIFCPGGPGGQTPAPTQAPTPPPTTQAPTPPPTTQAPTPAPTPPPTTQAPTPAPTPEPTADPQILAHLRVQNTDGSSSNSSSSSSSSVGSSSSSAAANKSDQLEAGVIVSTSTQVTSVVLNPIHKNATADASASGGNAQQASTQTVSDSNHSFGIMMLTVVGGVACIAGTVVFVAVKKKQQLAERERKDSVFSPEQGMLTPIDDIQCI